MTDYLTKKDVKEIQQRILVFRGEYVIIDKDLAEIYEVKTKALNQAVKRNEERFPEDFSFQLTKQEKDQLVTNCDRFKSLKHSTTTPHVFTEQGVAMLSSVLASKVAVMVSIKIMQAFVDMRKFLHSNAGIFQRMERVELIQQEHEHQIEKLFTAIEQKQLRPDQGIFFDGQVFDAWQFVTGLVKSAEKSIVLIDNYIDSTVLALLSEKNKNVNVVVLTLNMSQKLETDLKKFNRQYGGLEIKRFNKSHDRFLIIDENTVFHFGASLKDLGKKWFAFSKMERDVFSLLKSLKELI